MEISDNKIAWKSNVQRTIKMHFGNKPIRRKKSISSQNVTEWERRKVDVCSLSLPQSVRAPSNKGRAQASNLGFFHPKQKKQLVRKKLRIKREP